MNTFGLRSVNTESFNLKWHTNHQYPKFVRDNLVTLIRVHNLTLNILGYISKTSGISGLVRMATGLMTIGVTLAKGERHATSGMIIAHWYDEALLTGIAQIVRGALEAFIPYGHAINASLDVIATVYNISKEFPSSSKCHHCMTYDNHEPYDDVEYPIPLRPLYLV